MTDPELFKFDVRVRERMLRRSAINDGELEQHLAKLSDLDEKCDNLNLRQPALGRGEPESSARPSGPPAAPRSVPPPPPRPDADFDDDWGDGR